MCVARSQADAVNSSGVALLATKEVDFDGDEVQLVEYWADEYAAIPVDVHKKMGLKISYNEAGEPEFTEVEGFVSGARAGGLKRGRLRGAQPVSTSLLDRSGAATAG